jgi:type I restriction enzyme S subunit
MESHKLCEYIEKLSRPNSDLEYGIEDVCGVTNTKEISIGTKANLIGRTFEKFTILQPSEFIFNRRTSRNGEKISIAFNNLGRDVILTEDYCHFRIKKECEDVLNPEYLYLFFRNPEFDRYARYNSWGSATEFFNWDDMCEVPIKLPSIERQLECVREYTIITNQMKSLEKKVESLLKVVDHIFDKYFYQMKEILKNYTPSTFDKKTLPEGWNIDEAQTFFDITIGKTPPRENEDYFSENDNDIKWVSIADMRGCFPYLTNTSEKITIDAMNDCNMKIVPAGSVLLSFKLTVGRVAIVEEDVTTNEAIAHFKNCGELKYFIYSYLRNFDYNLLGSTSSISTAVNSKIIKAMPIIVPNEVSLMSFNEDIKVIFNQIYVMNREFDLLKKLRENVQ